MGWEYEVASGWKTKKKPTNLSMLIAHKLKMLAVHSKTSRDIQISQRIHPKCQDPLENRIQFIS